MRKAVYTIILTLLTGSICSAQKPILAAPVDSNQIRLLHDAARIFIWQSEQHPAQKDIYLDSAVKVLKTSLPVAESLNMRSLIRDIYWRIGAVYLIWLNDAEGKKWIAKASSDARLDGNEMDEADALYGAARITPASLKIMPYVDSILQRARFLFRKNKQPEKLVKTVRVAAEHHSKMGMFYKAETEYLTAIDLYRSLNIHKTGEVYILLSSMNRYQGNFNKSISYALQCLKQTENRVDTVKPELLYGELALVYDGLGQAPESIKWYRKALAEREKLVGYEGTVYMFRTAGFLIQQLIKTGKAQEAFSLINDLKKKYPAEKPVARSVVARILGHCYEARKDYGNAERQYLEAVKQCINAGVSEEFNEMMSIAYQDIGRFYTTHQQYEKAGIYLQKAINVPPATIPLIMQRDLQLMLFTADSAAGKYLSAINHYRQYNLLNDSLFNETKTKQIQQIQVQFETEKKEKEIILLNEQSRLQEAEIQRSATIRNMILIGILMAGSFFYYRYNRKQKTNRQLQLQQAEINQKNKALQNLVNEKEWLLREIHHRVKNNLQIIMALLESQSIYLENNIPALKAIQDSQHRVHSMSLIHKKLYKSDNTSTINMVVYIHELVDYLRESFHTEQSIYFEIEVDKIELYISQAVPIGLMMNEAITNAIKYAFPGITDARLSISMKEISKGNFLLQISDNGIGFPDDVNVNQPESLGLSLMKGLSEEIEGTFSIQSNQGTTIKIQFSSPV